jgi:hypothetical protein
MRSTYNILVRKSEGKRLLERSKGSWKTNIKIDLIEIGLEILDLIPLSQDIDFCRDPVNSTVNILFSGKRWGRLD